MLHNPIPEEEGFFELSEAVNKKASSDLSNKTFSLTSTVSNTFDNVQIKSSNSSQIACTSDDDCKIEATNMYCGKFKSRLDLY